MSRERSIRQLLLPYLFKRVEGDLWIALNREYKPLGCFPDDWVDYRTHPSVFRFRMTESLARKISIHGRMPEFDTHWPYSVFLYNDSTIPERYKHNRDDYFNRLSLVVGRKVYKP